MKQTKIEWTEATWNPTIGCTKKSEGCRNCYAEVMAKRLHAMGVKGYENVFQFTLMPNRLAQPYLTKKPTKFFVNSMSDLFHEDMPDQYLEEIFKVIADTPQHTYQILTKRAERMHAFLKSRTLTDNIWLGVTVENQKAKHRIDLLRNINAKIRFLSVEPLLEDLGEINLKNIHWVIVGGESGQRARPMQPEWAINVHKECKKQNVAFFFKQWGTWGADGVRRNKKVNGRLLLSKEWNEEPHLEKRGI